MDVNSLSWKNCFYRVGPERQMSLYSVHGAIKKSTACNAASFPRTASNTPHHIMSFPRRKSEHYKQLTWVVQLRRVVQLRWMVQLEGGPAEEGCPDEIA